MPELRLLVSATGTEVGKTWVSRGICRAWKRRGHEVRGLKPMETGVDPVALDATALARAAGHPPVHHGFYRVKPPVAPLTATRMGEPAPPPLDALAAAIDTASTERTLVEAAGGVLVPITESETVLELFAKLSGPLVLVTRDALGVLSHTLTAVEAVQRRGLDLVAIVLTPGPSAERDPSVITNASLLAELTGVTTFSIARCEDDDDALADELEASGLIDTLAR